MPIFDTSDNYIIAKTLGRSVRTKLTEAIELTQQNTTDIAAIGSGGSVDWVDVTGKPTFATVAISGSYADLSSIPATFTPSSHTHSYSSLTGLPTLFSGVYSDLSGIPTPTTTVFNYTGAWQPYTIPAGATKLIIINIGAGGKGGDGAIGCGGAGGGAGTTGGLGGTGGHGMIIIKAIF